MKPDGSEKRYHLDFRPDDIVVFINDEGDIVCVPIVETDHGPFAFTFGWTRTSPIN